MFSNINNDHIKGALVGVGVCAAGYYVYKKRQTQIDDFLKKQGINVASKSNKDYSQMSLEELMETKELLEDLIAEKEITTCSSEGCCETVEAE
ncbi:hypothetical protein B2H94_04940 [Clostridium sporogenes]|uniref:Uncharacterized protein n=2 Tax=Clostridium TaxID=1485 RepID=A0AAE5CBA0_CLOSG|nr:MULTISPECIES: hypothetical protein [Clostridium]MBE6076516.1 hypothetical protein [Clostridium lundense]APF27570.1 hypothetical protein NPD7_1728 [Clostridium sporogenes]EDU37478.1 hypothetical protein CLOSPO_03647 [Clostridium sporogenes ATCC 15579]KIS23319.1 Tat pathway signal protein [Clostridium botulinum B2 450]MBD5640457.1 hypothetical protein [Clostridium botulinum]